MNDLTDLRSNLHEAWSYEFSYWKRTNGFNPVALIESEDRSLSWEMDRFHIFKMANGTYATVNESGCSCYDPSWATIDFFKTLSDAEESMDAWRRGKIVF